jgi:hypothetical protein
MVTLPSIKPCDGATPPQPFRPIPPPRGMGPGVRPAATRPSGPAPERLRDHRTAGPTISGSPQGARRPFSGPGTRNLRGAGSASPDAMAPSRSGLVNTRTAAVASFAEGIHPRGRPAGPDAPSGVWGIAPRAPPPRAPLRHPGRRTHNDPRCSRRTQSHGTSARRPARRGGKPPTGTSRSPPIPTPGTRSAATRVSEHPRRRPEGPVTSRASRRPAPPQTPPLRAPSRRS